MLRQLGSPTVYPEAGKPTSRYDEEEEEEADQKTYQEIVGSLNYATTATRPDIAFVVGILGRFAANSARRHMCMAIRVMRYLKKTASYRLVQGDRNGKGGFEMLLRSIPIPTSPEIQTYLSQQRG